MMDAPGKLKVSSGVTLILIQLASNFQSYQSLSKDILQFKQEFKESLIERELYFSRKSEIAEISKKLDQANGEILRMKKHMASIQKIIKDDFDFHDSEELTGCQYDESGEARSYFPAVRTELEKGVSPVSETSSNGTSSRSRI